MAFAKSTISEANLTSEMSRVPPHNLEAEQAVLGALLIDKDAMTRVADVVTPDDFYKETHRMIMEAMLELYERREPIDLLSLTNRLGERNQLDTVGGRSYIMTVANAVPTASNILSYATIVQRKATLRRLLTSASTMVEMAYKEDEDIDIILDEAEQSLFKVTQKYLKQNFIPISTALTEAFERIDEIHKEGGKLRGLPTGFADLDRRLGGLQKSDLIILAARPSIGKTSLALDIVRNIAVQSKVPVGVFSLEMSKDQLVDRLISAEAKVDMWKMRTGELSDAGPHNDFERIGHALGILSEAPIYIDDSGSSNVMEIRTKARRLQAEHGLGLVVIDYLQLMEGRKRTDNRTQEVSEISRSLKALARELNVPVLALSQLSRAVEMSSPPIPKLSHLRESGCLTGDTLIMRADTGEQLQMDDLAKREDQTPIPVFALDEHFRTTIAMMTKVFSSGRKRVFKLRTRSGRIIRASANHPFRTLLGWKRLDTLALGERIALPRSVSPAAESTNLQKEELGLLAHLLGDGCVLPRQPIHYTSGDWKNIQYVSTAAKKLFGITPRIVAQENWWHVYLPSPYQVARGRRHPIMQWFVSLGISAVRAGEKKVSDKIFEESPANIAYFLHHLWSTDGNISWKKLPKRLPSAAIYYASTSEELSRGVQHLLLRLGIQSTLRISRKEGYDPSHQVHIQGKENQLRFLKRIGSYGGRGDIIPDLTTALDRIEPHPNVDVIPREAWKTIVQTAKDAREYSWREIQRGLGTAYCGSALFKAGIGRERMLALAVSTESTAVANLATSDVYWDEVMEIIPQGIEEVYDATVPGPHNFLANDIFVHNSIEQDSDVVIFIYREGYYKKDSMRPNEADIIIAKHRNGPTGEVSLIFQNEYVSFANMARESYVGEPPPVEAPFPTAIPTH